jgi:hypothetical protein
MTLPWISRILASQQPQNGAADGDEDTPAFRLRQRILAEGIPDEEQHDGGSSSRSIAWKVLLGVDELDCTEYLHLVSLGSSAAHDKIANDT